MGRGDLSRINLRKRREVTWGVFDAGALRTLNLVNEGLKGAPDIKQSQSAKSNRLPGPPRKTAVVGAGPIETELIAGPEFEEFLEEALCSAIVTMTPITSSVISFASGDNSINGTALFGNIVDNTWIEITGYAANGQSAWTDGWAWVVSHTADKVVLAYQTVVTNAGGSAVTVSCKYLRNGVTPISATYERENADFSTDRYQAYLGQMVNTMALKFTFEEIIRATFNLTGKGPSAKTSTSIANPTAPTAAESFANIMDVSNNMRAFREGGALNGNVKSFDLTLNNNNQYIKLAQTQQPDGISMGVASLSGNLEGYLVDAAGRQTAAFGYTPTSFHLRVTADAGYTYFLTLFRVRYSDMGDQPKSGNQGPVPFATPWVAEEDPTTGCWIQFGIFPHP